MKKNTHFSLHKLMLCVCCVIQLACTKTTTKAETSSLNNAKSSSEEKHLEKILSSPSLIFSDGRGEAHSIAKNILENKESFLEDLFEVLKNDTNDLLVLADKKHFLEKSFVPQDIVALVPNDFYKLNRNDLSLRRPAEDALRKMAEAAKLEGLTLLVSSTYRSYEYQEKLYNRNVKQLGKEVADRESAKPGTSQHQLGTAIDFGSITDDFALTKAGMWLAAKAGNWGFSLSYPEGYESVTGYRWECWHYRYIGKQAVDFQKRWFYNVQQYMLEFIHYWKTSAL